MSDCSPPPQTLSRSHDRFLPHPPPAALRLRRSECDEGGGAGAGRATSSISAWAIPTARRRPCHRETVPRSRAIPRAHRYSASKGIAGLRKAQAGYYARRFGGRARSGQRGDRHPGLEGGARQSRPGDHRARRRRARAQPVLPDPHLRLHHRRRRDPLDPGRAGARTSSTCSSGRCATPCRSPRCW